MEAPCTPAQPLTRGRPLTSSNVCGVTLLHGERHVSVAPQLAYQRPDRCRLRRPASVGLLGTRDRHSSQDVGKDPTNGSSRETRRTGTSGAEAPCGASRRHRVVVVAIIQIARVVVHEMQHASGAFGRAPWR